MLLLGVSDIEASAPPADPIGDPFFLGSAIGAATGNVKEITTGAAVAAGSVIKAALVTRSAVTAVTVTDQAGNSYALLGGTSINHGLMKFWLAEAKNVTALPSGNWIRFAPNTEDYCVGHTIAIPNAHRTSPVDVNEGPFVGTTTDGAFAESVGPFMSTAEQIAIEWLTLYDGSGATVITPSTGFTALTPVTSATDEYEIHCNWRRIAQTSDLALNAAWDTTASTQRVGANFQSIRGPA